MSLEPSWLWFAKPVANVSGCASITLWLFAQIPQVVKIYEDKSVEGLSWAFLACWYLGDLLNFTSCILNEALMFQVLLSGYYCIIDTILVAQYYYYSNMYHNPESRWYHRPRSRKLILSPKSSLRENLIMYPSEPPQPRSLPMVFKSGSFIQKGLLSASFISSFSKVQAVPIDNIQTPHLIDNSLLHRLIVHLSQMHFNMGHFMAWTCTFLYLSSRIPQLFANHKLKSTKGISMKLITFALLGNICYSISLIFNEDSIAGGDTSARFWNSQLSYFMGAIGTVIFDFTLICQWFVYRRNDIYFDDDDDDDKITFSKSKYNSENEQETKQAPNPINFPDTLSPAHVKKLSKSTPLSPMDFLIQPSYGSTEFTPKRKEIPTMAMTAISPNNSDMELIFHAEH